MIQGVKIAGMGYYVPDNVIKNDYFLKIGYPKELLDRYGVKERRYSKNETGAEMEYKAALKAIEDAGIDENDIDLIIDSAIITDQIFPVNSNKLLELLELDKIPAFDLNYGSLSQIMQIVTAANFISSGQYKCILVVTSCNWSKAVDLTDDYQSCLGDGAAALILQKGSKKQGVMGFNFVSKGEYYDTQGGFVNKPKNKLDVNINAGEKLYFVRDDMILTDQNFLDFFFNSMPETVNKTLKMANLKTKDIDYLALHQVDVPIFNQWRKDIGCENIPAASTVEKYGNCGNPNAIINLVEGRDYLSKGKNVLMVAATFSFSVGSLVFKL